MSSQTLSRIIRVIASSPEGEDSRPQVGKQIARRISAIQSVYAIVYLIKLNKITSSKERMEYFRKLVRNSSSLSLVSSLYPILLSIFSGRFPHKTTLLWCSTISSALLMAKDIPNWLVSYVTVESISDKLFSIRSIKAFISEWEDSTLIICRQAALCAIVPILYAKSSMGLRSSGAGKILFSKRPVLRDFIMFYSIWNFLSAYNFGKSMLLRTKRNKTDISIRNPFHYPEEWPIRSSNMKPLMDKLTEIHEITLRNSFSIFDKFMNSPIIQNVIPCLKWALWRQLCYKSLTHVPRSNHRSAVNSKLMQSITMMLAFFVLDGRENKMNVRPGVLRYLIRCVLNHYLVDFNQKYLKIQLFIMSQLAFSNATRNTLRL